MITGLNGCSCHSFDSWEECNKAHKQKFEIGAPVQNRHTLRKGTIREKVDGQGYTSVKYGKYPRDCEQEHVAMLIRL